jgi:tRNA nucleotidyltransferase/poly(A) polymerase
MIKNWKKFIESKKSGFNYPSSIDDLNKIFNKFGYKLYIVGGAVRDFITGDVPKDFDLATDALPDDILRILAGKYPVQLQGESFGVVVVRTPDFTEGMEIATFREDLTDGRNPEVKLGTSIDVDVKRRDLTINSLFYDLESGEIVDLVGGKSDLENGIIRMVGDPEKRISEDPLRVLRVLRFAARYGSKIDDLTDKALMKHNKLTGVSFERIWDSRNGEFLKAFKQSKNFGDYIGFLTRYNLWEQILPGLKINLDIDLTKSRELGGFELVMAQLLLGNDISKIKSILSKCSISNYLINCITFLHNLLDFKEEDILKMYKLSVRYLIYPELIDNWLSVMNISDKPVNKFTKFKPTVDVDSIMKEYGLPPSKELGDKINELEIENFKKLK